MGSSSSQQGTDQHQWGAQDPWAPAQNALYSILGGIQGNLAQGGGPGTLNGDQQNAINRLQSNAASMPNYGSQAAGVASGLLGGGTNYQPMVSDAYSQYQGAISPVLNASLDPTQTPGIANALETIRNDVGNSVNGMFAGAGRDLSGLNQQSLARGISQGEAPVLLGQYNQNVANRQNAANGILSGAQSTAATNSGLQQTAFGNQLQGLNVGVNTVPQAYNSNALQSLQAAGLSQQIPAENLARLAALTIPIAGLGRNFSGGGESITNGSSSPSTLQTIQGLFGGGAGSTANGVMGGLGQGLGILGAFL